MKWLKEFFFALLTGVIALGFGAGVTYMYYVLYSEATNTSQEKYIHVKEKWNYKHELFKQEVQHAKINAHRGWQFRVSKTGVQGERR